MVHVDLLQALRMKNENSWCLTTEESDCQGKDLTLQENINSEVIMKILPKSSLTHASVRKEVRKIVCKSISEGYTQKIEW